MVLLVVTIAVMKLWYCIWQYVVSALVLTIVALNLVEVLEVVANIEVSVVVNVVLVLEMEFTNDKK